MPGRPADESFHPGSTPQRLPNAHRFRGPAHDAYCDLERLLACRHASGILTPVQSRSPTLTDALLALGQGFLEHPDNGALRGRLQGGVWTAEDYFREIIRILYRLVFSLAADKRQLLRRAAGAPLVASLAGALANTASTAPSALDAPPQSRLRDDVLASVLAELGGFLRTSELGKSGAAGTAARELGASYEGLLELVPEVEADARSFRLAPRTLVKGNTRRALGSYYTPEPLIEVLLDRALEPVIAEAIAARPEAPVEALLGLSILDPACGTGYFLVAGAQRIAAHIARLEASGAPEPAAQKLALGRVIRRCLYGVDVDPIALELCKMSLWLEVSEPGLSLSFADQQLKQGHALLGTAPGVSARWDESAKNKKNNERSELTARTPAEGGPRPLHFELEFPRVFERGGFDVVLGNPPWIAHAGRAAQALAPDLKRYFRANYEAFADYPTTHGMFVTRAAQCLAPGGRLGLVVPSSLSELEGYAPTRRAHDRLCEFPAELVDFGEGRFTGVTQPCMALVSRRAPSGRSDRPHGKPWPVERPDLDDCARALVGRLDTLPRLPSELFGERGVQSDRKLAEHFKKSSLPVECFTTPLREGSDVREFELLPPRFHVNREALGSRIRKSAEFQSVSVLIRQTARFPIAALSDGQGFRNSLLAGFGNETWPAAALVALLNSALIRWYHFVRFRDARQPVMPQLKIAHLRALPEPDAVSSERHAELGRLGRELSDLAYPSRLTRRTELDELVYDLFTLTPEERSLVSAWHAELNTLQGANSRSVRRREPPFTPLALAVHAKATKHP